MAESRKMPPTPPPPAAQSAEPSATERERLADFHAALSRARNILVIAGAGLSASSGLPTYRGAAGSTLWRDHDATVLCTEASFRRDPGLVWQYHTHFRQLALDARPNPAHYALAEAARRFAAAASDCDDDGDDDDDDDDDDEGGRRGGGAAHSSFMLLTQNVDRLSTRAGHPPESLRELHGSHFNLRCVDAEGCGYFERDNLRNPLTPALRLDDDDDDGEDKDKEGSTAAGRKTSGSSSSTATANTMPKASLDLIAGIARKNREILGAGYVDRNPLRRDVGALRSTDEKDKMKKKSSHDNGDGGDNDDNLEIPFPPPIPHSALPHCPRCGTNLLRPDVVWFGEPLPASVDADVEALFSSGAPPIDLCLVVGTSGLVWPAAGFALRARGKGARVAVVNKDFRGEDAMRNMRPGDWVFEGDAAVLVPRLLEPVTGMGGGG